MIRRGSRLDGARPSSMATGTAAEGASNLNALAGWLLLISLVSSFLVMAEPAPTDIAFIGALACIAMSLRWRISPNAAAYALLAYIFLLANSVSAVSCLNAFHCSRYMFITFYLVSIPLVMSHLAASFGAGYVRRMYAAFFGAIIISAATGILARAAVLPGPTELFFREEGGLRLSPFFKDPNVYGPFLGAGLVLYAGHVVSGSRRLVPGVLILGLIWIPMFLAFSRAAWLAVAVSAIVYVALSLGFVRARDATRRLAYIFLGTLGILLPLSFAILVQFDLLWFFERRLGLQSYDTERFSSHSTAVDVALANPLGIGPGRFIGQTHLPGSEFALAAHNVYLKIWVENGWIGILSFLAMILFVIVALARLVVRPTSRLPIHLALMACLIGILVNGYFIDTLHWRHLFVVLGFGLVELDAYRGSHRSARADEPLTSR